MTECLGVEILTFKLTADNCTSPYNPFFVEKKMKDVIYIVLPIAVSYSVILVIVDIKL